MKDQLNRILHIQQIPKRIVSLVPSQTELLYDLGLEASIVGITKFCVHPIHFKKNIANVGGTKEVHYDKIKALQPDIILCNKEENTLEMIAELEQIAPVHISDIYNIADCLELIAMYGSLFSKEEKALEIMNAINETHDDFKAFMQNKPTLTAAYFIWKNPWMVASKNTFIDAMMQFNKLENYYGHLNRYPEIQLQESQKETADVVLLSSEPFPFKKLHAEEIKKYFPHSKIIIVDGEAFSWYGTRLIAAFDYFKSLHQGPLKALVSNS